MAKYCKSCGSIIICDVCSNRGCKNGKYFGEKKKRWIIGNDLIDFEKSVTFQDAQRIYNLSMKKIKEGRFNKKGKSKND